MCLITCTSLGDSLLVDGGRRPGRRRLAQFRMGSHMLGVGTGRWQRLPRAERICQRCSCGVVDDEAHMVWGCSALIDQRVQHAELFQDSNIKQTFCSRMPGSWQLSCGFVMIIVQSWMGVLPVGLSGPFRQSAGSEHYLGHDSLCMLLWVFPPEPVARP
jgi:hypothetical protein